MAEKDFEDVEETVFDEKFYESVHEQIKTNSTSNDFSQYARPPLNSNYCSENHDFTFMQTDCDYYIGRKLGSDEESGIIRIYGVTKEGNSVLAHIHNFISYFYIEKPSELEDDYKTLEDLRRLLMVYT